MVVVIITALILAGLGLMLKSAAAASAYCVFGLVFAAIVAGVWYMGEDEDRDILRRIFAKITGQKWPR